MSTARADAIATVSTARADAITNVSTARAGVIATALIAALGLSACTQSVEVLGAVVPDLAAVPDGGLTDAPDLPDPPVVRGDAGACGNCGPLPLCAPDGCLDATGPTSIETGRFHTCLVRDGRLSCWGNGGDGRLGLGDRNGRDAPARVGSLNDWRIASGGERHTCGVRAPGALYCWGFNEVGQLGLGDTEDRLTPTRVQGFDDWTDLDCGGYSCCALRDGGHLYCWGDNLEGKPGQDDRPGDPDVLAPREVVGDHRFRSVAIGQGHVCAIDTAGALWCWGRNILGETGTAVGQGQTRAPRLVDEGTRWSSVSGSQHHTCGTQDDGSLWCWGSAACGELGNGIIDDAHFEATPVMVGTDTDWARVEVGWFHSCALKKDGRMFCWGRTIEGQLGFTNPVNEVPDVCPEGDYDADPLAMPKAPATDARFVALALGAFHTCAIADDGTLYCMGENNAGQLGLDDQERRNTPTPLP